MPLIDKFRYRPEIDGLRDIAVLAVVLFHAGFSCTGGYVGVDVFFVISGFLIISLIWKDLESGKFAFAHFWERRARRIVPAIAAVTLAVLIAGWFILLPGDFRDLGQASAAQSIFAANFYYWQHTGYFATAAELQPLLHTWSLAVEEQFYFIAPLLLWGMFRFVTLRRRAAVLAILATGFMLSFALSIYGVARDPTAAFYLLPTRAWELLLGALVAFIPLSAGRLDGRIFREGLALGGLALILIPIWRYTPATPFPGLAALAPCLGTALIIWANGPGIGDRLTLIGRALSNRPLVFVGLVSYSFYLWHWPLLSFSRYLALEPLSIGYRVAAIALGFVLSVLSWKYVETPFRVRKLGATRKSIFTYAGTGLAMIFIVGVACMAARGFPNRFSRQALKFAHAVSDKSFLVDMATEDVRSGHLLRLGVTDPAQHPAVLVWGDSHAMAALPAFDAFLKERGWAGRAAVHSSTAPTLGWFKMEKYGLNDRAVAFNDAVLDYVRRQHVPTVVLAAYWRSYQDKDGRYSDAFKAALLATVRRLVAVGAQPWMMLDVPRHPFNVPRALALAATTDPNIRIGDRQPAARNRLDQFDPAFIAQIEAAGGRMLDPKPCFLDATGRRYLIQRDGVALYRDGQHLTTTGAKLMLLPFLRETFVVSANPARPEISTLAVSLSETDHTDIPANGNADGP